MAKNTETLNQLLDPIVAKLGYEFVGCQYFPQGRHSILRVYIDSPRGVTLDDCQRVSEQISAVLDIEDPIRGHYSLEVSSPGMERPLFTPEHYRRFIGQRVQIRLHSPLQNRRNFAGILRNVIEENVVIDVEGVEFQLPLANIEKANLIPTW